MLSILSASQMHAFVHKGVRNVCYNVYFVQTLTFNPPINISYRTFNGYQCLLMKCTIMGNSLPCEPTTPCQVFFPFVYPSKDLYYSH